MNAKERGSRRVGLALISISALIAAAPSICRAQTSAAGTPTEDRSRDEAPAAVTEVVVTARYKAEPAQATPMSIVAIDTRQLEDLGAQQFVDYASTVPGLSFQDRGPNRNNVVIRGISPLTGNSAVGLYLDGIEQSYFNNNPDFGLFDIGRIEVLLGPQGTLYGEGSLGGTIRIFTVEPELKQYDAKLEAIASDTDHGGGSGAFNAVANLPLGDQVAFRLSGYDRYQSGWIDNVVSGQNDVNYNRDSGVRAAVRFQPNDNLDVQAIANYQQDQVGLLNVQDPSLGEYKIGVLTPQGENQRNAQYTGLATYHVRYGSFQETIGYNDEQDARGVDSATTVGVPGFDLNYDAHSRIFSNETRFVSDLQGSLNFVLGAYYKNLTRSVALDLVDGGLLLGAPGDYVNAGITKDQTVALYGEGYYQITERLKATVGLRWSTDNVAFPESTTVGAIVLSKTDLSGSYTAVTPKVGLAFQQNPNLLLYANIAEGYRPGGVNPIPDPSPFYVQTYQPDRAWNYEVGVKSETTDHRYRANLSLYYISWKNLQILGEPNNPALGFTTNAGSAHSQGFEASVAAVPLRGLELDLALGYADPRLDAPAEGLAAGTTLPGVSKLNASLGMQYKWPLRGRWQGVARADVWTHSHTDTAPAYSQANLRVGVENERWDAMLFVENASDNKLITVTASEGQFIGRPRTVGVDLRARF